LKDEKAQKILEQWTSYASIEYATFHVYKVWHEDGLRPMQIASRWQRRTWLIPALIEPIDFEIAKAVAREAFGNWSYLLTLEGQWELFARFLLRETCQILGKKREDI